MHASANSPMARPGQLLVVHSDCVSENSSPSARVFGEDGLAGEMGRIHDIGKDCEPFQRQVKGQYGPKVDHIS